MFPLTVIFMRVVGQHEIMRSKPIVEYLSVQSVCRKRKKVEKSKEIII